MPSTYLSLHYHLIFGTKNQEPIVHSQWRRRLHAHMGGIVKTLDGVPESIGGVADHVHMLVRLRATHTLADVLRETKSVSSGWVHDEIGVRSFAWQEGYAAFTVSASQLKRVRPTSRIRKNISGLAHFGTNISLYWSATGSSLMSAI